MYRLEYSFDEEEDEPRKESIVVDKDFVILAAGDNVDIALDAGTPGRYSIEQAKNGQVTLQEVEGEGALSVNDQAVHAAELRDGDIVSIGEVEFKFFGIVPPMAIQTRKSSPMQLFSGLSVAFLLLAQAVFLVWVLIFWRVGQTPLLAEETTTEPVELAQAKPQPKPATAPPQHKPEQTAPTPSPAPPPPKPVAAPQIASAPDPKVGEPVLDTPQETAVSPAHHPPSFPKKNRPRLPPHPS